MKNKLLSIITAAAALSLTLSTIAVILCTKAYIRVSYNRTELTTEPTCHDSFDSICDSTADAVNAAADNFDFDNFDNNESILLFYDQDYGELIAVNARGDKLYSSVFEICVLNPDEANLLRDGIVFNDMSELASAIEDLTS